MASDKLRPHSRPRKANWRYDIIKVIKGWSRRRAERGLKLRSSSVPGLGWGNKVDGGRGDKVPIEVREKYGGRGQVWQGKARGLIGRARQPWALCRIKEPGGQELVEETAQLSLGGGNGSRPKNPAVEHPGDPRALGRWGRGAVQHGASHRYPRPDELEGGEPHTDQPRQRLTSLTQPGQRHISKSLHAGRSKTIRDFHSSCVTTFYSKPCICISGPALSGIRLSISNRRHTRGGEAHTGGTSQGHPAPGAGPR